MECLRPRQNGGSATRPNSTVRGNPGTKRDLVTDARGAPLGVYLSGANQHDNVKAPTLNAVPPLRNAQRGRPRRRPDKLRGGNSYDEGAALGVRGARDRTAQHEEQ